MGELQAGAKDVATDRDRVCRDRALSGPTGCSWLSGFGGFSGFSEFSGFSGCSGFSCSLRDLSSLTPDYS